MPAALAALLEGVGVEGLLAIAAFTFFVQYLVARGLLVTWTSTFGKAFVWLATHLSFHIRPFGHTIRLNFGEPFATVNNSLVNWLEAAASDAEQSIAWTWRAMGTVWRANVAAVEWASHELADSMDWLIKVRLPKWARAAFAVAFPAAYLLKLIAGQVRKLVAHPLRTIKVIERAVPQKIVQVFKLAGAAALPGVLGIPLIWKEIHGLTRRNARINARLRKLERAAGATAAAAVIANALGLPRACVRPGGNLRRLARVACGAPSWIVRFLVAGAIEAFILSDLCDFSDLLMKQTKTLRPVLMELVSVENALVGCHDFDAPRVFTLPPVSLPAPVDAVSLAA